MTKKSEINVPTRLLHTPLLVSAAEAEIISGILRGDIHVNESMGLFGQGDQRRYEVQNGVAILPVMGGLTYRGYGWYWRATYGQIRSDFRAALADPDVRAIVFDMDSPGGEVAGCFDLADEIFEARGTKSIFAVVNENCFSAAYAIASAADKIFIPRTGNAGSIGVIAIHAEQSKFDEDIGVKWTAIYAGARKNDFSTHRPLSAEAFQAAQKNVDASYDLFCQAVARNRSMSVDAVKATQAAIYKGADAVATGLADAVASWDQAMEEILSQNSINGGIVMKPEDVKTGLAAMIGDPATKDSAHQLIQELGFVPAADQPDLEAATTAARDEGRKEGQQAAVERAVSIAGICDLAGPGTMCAGLIKEGVSIEDAQTRVTEAKAAESGQFQVLSATTPTGTGQVSPLVADAQKRAGVN